MKKPRKVFEANNLPTRLPLGMTVLCWLALDHWKAPQWMYGAAALLFVILWLNAIYDIGTEEKVDFFKNDETK
jgi:hypothetical protein